MVYTQAELRQQLRTRVRTSAGTGELTPSEMADLLEHGGVNPVDIPAATSTNESELRAMLLVQARLLGTVDASVAVDPLVADELQAVLEWVRQGDEEEDRLDDFETRVSDLEERVTTLETL